MPTFTIDEANSDDEYLYVDVSGKGTVEIKAEGEGIVVSIFPFHVVEEPVASTWAHDNDLVPPEDVMPEESEPYTPDVPDVEFEEE